MSFSLSLNYISNQRFELVIASIKPNQLDLFTKQDIYISLLWFGRICGTYLTIFYSCDCLT